ncbi:MAG: hypothetical protein P8176_07775 [Gammaproteobacteria bacterium]
MKDAIKAQLLQLNTSLAETNSITALRHYSLAVERTQALGVLFICL